MVNVLDKVQPKNKKQLKQLIDYAFKHNIYDLNFIDTSEITDMSNLFEDIRHNFDVSKWDMSNVTDISFMFYGCHNFNCDLSRWNVSKVENMSGMFKESRFNGDISKWNVSKVRTMKEMFMMSVFNQDISSRKLRRDCTTIGMFNECPITDEFKPSFK